MRLAEDHCPKSSHPQFMIDRKRIAIAADIAACPFAPTAWKGKREVHGKMDRRKWMLSQS